MVCGRRRRQRRPGLKCRSTPLLVIRRRQVEGRVDEEGRMVDRGAGRVGVW